MNFTCKNIGVYVFRSMSFCRLLNQLHQPLYLDQFASMSKTTRLPHLHDKGLVTHFRALIIRVVSDEVR